MSVSIQTINKDPIANVSVLAESECVGRTDSSGILNFWSKIGDIYVEAIHPDFAPFSRIANINKGNQTLRSIQLLKMVEHEFNPINDLEFNFPDYPLSISIARNNIVDNKGRTYEG